MEMDNKEGMDFSLASSPVDLHLESQAFVQPVEVASGEEVEVASTPAAVIPSLKTKLSQFNPPRSTKPQRTVGSELLPELLGKIDPRYADDDGDDDDDLENACEELPRTSSSSSPVRAKRMKLEKQLSRSGNKQDTCSADEPEPEENSEPSAAAADKNYNVLYANPTTKKHKTWGGDGTLKVVNNGQEMELRDESGQILSLTSNFKLPDGFGEGSEIQIGSKVVQIQDEIKTLTKMKKNSQKNGSAPSSPKPTGPTVRSARNLQKEDALPPPPESMEMDVEDNPPLEVTPAAAAAASDNNVKTTIVYHILYAKPTTKKHKTWDGDGTLTVVNSGKEMILRDENDQYLATSSNFKLPAEFGEGTEIQIGGKVVQIQDIKSQESRKTVPTATAAAIISGSSHSEPATVDKPFKMHQVPEAAAIANQMPLPPPTSQQQYQSSGTFQSPLLPPEPAEAESSGILKFSVLYAKPTKKKHKSWEGDGLLTITDNGKEVVLTNGGGGIDDDERVIVSVSNFKLPPILEEGTELMIGGKIIEISRKLI